MKQEIPNPTIPAMEGTDPSSSGRAPDSAGRSDPAPSAEGRALLEALLRQWRPILLTGVVLALVAGVVGWRHWKPVHLAIAQVVRYESPNNEEVFRPRQTAPQTFAVALRSPQLLRLVGERADPKISADQLAERSRVTPEFNSDILTVAVTDADPARAVALANLYAREGVRFTQEIQADAAGEVVTYLQSQLASIEDQLKVLQPQSMVVPASGTAGSVAAAPLVGAAPSALVLRWQAARDELVNLLGTYTEAHPTVQAQRSRIAALEQEMKNQGVAPAMTGPTGNSLSPTGPATPAAPVMLATQPDREVVRSQLQSLENARAGLASRLNAAQLFRRDPPGYLRLFAEATPAEVTTESPRGKIVAVAGLGGLCGLGLAMGIVLLCEFGGSRLRTVADIERVTGLPVLASVGDLGKMTPAEESLWGFRTWTALQNRLTRSPNQGFVCALTSAGEGEGRSTWINLLARSAGQLGFRVLTVGTRSADAPAKSGTAVSSSEVSVAEAAGESPSRSLTTTTNVLASPAEVSAQLAHASDQALVHIPLPGWVWNLDRRKEWQTALGQWSLIDNVVILVELPPSDLAESVLLAQNLPNLLWLVDSGRADATETRRQLQTLRDARCHLVGALLNHQPSAPLQKLFPRWHQSAAGWSAAGA